MLIVHHVGAFDLSCSKSRLLLGLGGVSGVITPILVLSLILVAISYYSDFNWETNALSDLGVEGISAVIFNSSLILSGFLMVLFAAGLRVSQEESLREFWGVLTRLCSDRSMYDRDLPRDRWHYTLLRFCGFLCTDSSFHLPNRMRNGPYFGSS